LLDCREILQIHIATILLCHTRRTGTTCIYMLHVDPMCILTTHAPIVKYLTSVFEIKVDTYKNYKDSTKSPPWGSSEEKSCRKNSCRFRLRVRQHRIAQQVPQKADVPVYSRVFCRIIFIKSHRGRHKSAPTFCKPVFCNETRLNRML